MQQVKLGGKTSSQDYVARSLDTSAGELHARDRLHLRWSGGRAPAARQYLIRKQQDGTSSVTTAV